MSKLTDELRARIKELEAKLDRLPIDWDTEIDAYKRANDALRAEIRNLKDYGTLADEEVARLKAEVQELREKLTS